MNNTRLFFTMAFTAVVLSMAFGCAGKARVNLEELTEVRLFQGNDTTAYRDPAVLYHEGVFHLFFTLVRIEGDSIFSYVACSHSRDLREWSAVRILTPRDQNLNYSSPGNVVRCGDEWFLCVQTYPRPGYVREEMPRYGDASARLFLMRSRDLVEWDVPELMRVKGPDVPVEQMGRMIDPCIVRDKDEESKWWCLYKQNGVSMSYTRDFQEWTYAGNAESGENVCVWTEDGGYRLMHSPANGMGLKKSTDLLHWEEEPGLITLGQGCPGWEWAAGRVTAGAVVDGRQIPAVGKYLLFFHGSGPGDEQTDFDRRASIGIAWSSDLKAWEWPGKASTDGH